MKVFAALIAVLAFALPGCSPSVSAIRSTSVLGVVLYSDDEWAAMQTRHVTVDDLAAGLVNTQSTKLLPQTKVQVLQSAQIPVASDVAAPVQWTFDRVRVTSGPAAGREGWISTRQPLDGQPSIEPAT